MAGSEGIHPIEAAAKRVIAKVNGDIEARADEITAKAIAMYKMVAYLAFKTAVTGGKLEESDATMLLQLISRTCKSTFDLIIDELNGISQIAEDMAASTPTPTEPAPARLYDMNGKPIRTH